MIQNKIISCTQTFLIIALTGLVLSACAPQAENPKAVADQYWQYIQSGNTVEAEKLVSTESLPAYSENNHRRAVIEQFSNNETITIVSTTITTISPHSNFQRTQTFDTYLVLQQGRWKIDAKRTQLPATPNATEEEIQRLAEELSESMQENVESIDEAMNQGMQLLNETLREGSKEMGDSMLQLMNELNNKMHEAIDKMKQRRQQEPQNQPSQPEQLNPEQGEGKI